MITIALLRTAKKQNQPKCHQGIVGKYGTYTWHMSGHKKNEICHLRQHRSNLMLSEINKDTKTTLSYLKELHESCNNSGYQRLRWEEEGKEWGEAYQEAFSYS